ncbi:hypothetical protein [Streptomyces sp. NRRL F-5123]|uniref:hypothetical protein n=1 Tax=Streptomyces sp. NRRL F-5123 TaxID=1463856 RepID=UPI0004E27D1B|nr:hypothetical protein [Streptomyces sp. NRRL F-5123]
MRKFTKAFTGTAATGAAIIAAIGLAAGPASATTPTQVTISGSNTDGSFTALASKPTLKDNKTGVVLNCSSASAAGIANNGTHAGTQAATLTSLTWTSCNISGIGFGVTSNASVTSPWSLNATDVTDSTGKTLGNITGVHATLSGACNATVTGTVTGYYTNGTHTLSINAGTLTVSGVSGLCLGLINNGDSVTYTANYVTTPALQVTAS